MPLHHRQRQRGPLPHLRARIVQTISGKLIGIARSSPRERRNVHKGYVGVLALLVGCQVKLVDFSGYLCLVAVVGERRHAPIGNGKHYHVPRLPLRKPNSRGQQGPKLGTI